MRGARHDTSAARSCNCTVARSRCAAALVRRTASACACRVAVRRLRDWRARSARGTCNAAIAALRSTVARRARTGGRCTRIDWGCRDADRRMRSRDSHTRLTDWRSRSADRRAPLPGRSGVFDGDALYTSAPSKGRRDPTANLTGRLPVTSVAPEAERNPLQHFHMEGALSGDSDCRSPAFLRYAHTRLESVYKERHTRTWRA